MKILYVGETWLGSSARSLRDALAEQPAVEIEDIGEDHYFPKQRTWPSRGINRLLGPLHRHELARAIESRLAIVKPSLLLVYKGNGIAADVVERARRAGVLTVNVFPDCSPHAHGRVLRGAMGKYDLVISTKPFHPEHWRTSYGYQNRCIFVPHGYDPRVHLWLQRPATTEIDFDVVMAATWRPEYHQLLVELARRLSGASTRVGVAGSGWCKHRGAFPAHWVIREAATGRDYGEFLRKGKIAVAPVTRDVVVDGRRQPGDEDTTRTYELAASYCFFVHRRTAYVGSVYDEHTEVPMWDSADELATLIFQYLPRDDERAEMAARAHHRAVPAYSIAARARAMLKAISQAQRPDRCGME